MSDLEHTPGHVNCPACEELRQAKRADDIGAYLFPQAAGLWLESRANKNKKRTIADYGGYVRALSGFFGGLRLNQIHVGHLEGYQRERAAHAGARKINYELACLARILKRAGLWHPIAEFYEPLPVPYDKKPWAPSEQHVARLFTIAANEPRWQLVYWTALLASWTSLSGYEARGLQLGDVDLHGRVISVRPESAKRRGRVRDIPLVAAAYWAAERLVDRAHRLGSSEPQHYLFPFRISSACGGIYDPSRQASSSWIRKDWYALRSAAGLDRMRFHDVRALAITRLGEAGAPEDVVEQIAGHLTEAMRKHYMSIRLDRKRRALEQAVEEAGVSARGPQPVETLQKRAAKGRSRS